MKYKVENIVLFDADLNTLTHIETQECISLTMSQSMLLELILKSQSEILSRDTIIDTLWHRHGVNSSGHTLNQYISLLRKLFSHFGVGDLIITMPRVGVRLNPDVLVSASTITTLSEYAIDTKETIPTAGSSRLIHIDNKKRIIILLIIFVTGVLIALLVINNTRYNTSFSFHTDKGCEIGLKKHISPEDRKLIILQVREILNENKLACNSDRVIYFDFSKSAYGDDYGRALLAFCTKGDDRKNISCDNYYYRNWRVE